MALQEIGRSSCAVCVRVTWVEHSALRLRFGRICMPEATKAGRTKLWAPRRGEPPLLDSKVDWHTRLPDYSSTASAAEATGHARESSGGGGSAAQCGAAARERRTGGREWRSSERSRSSEQWSSEALELRGAAEQRERRAVRPRPMCRPTAQRRTAPHRTRASRLVVVFHTRCD